ncbi:hypothetical protein C0992_002895 [Termitomyces sp. T32_za158]|nr:hypothetical protein C0992_002895 [Termitomyces sp. T32_za158]
MFALVSLRIPAGRVSTASMLTRRAGVSFRWVSHTLTRSFITSVVRAESASDKPNTTTKTKESAPKKKSTEKTAGAKTKVKKAVKKPAKKTTLVIPPSVQIPRRGPSPYMYFMTKVFKPELPQNKENFVANSRACAEAWKSLSEDERQKCTELSKEISAKISQERQDYINALDPKIVRELNRRRVAKGKYKIHQKLPYPVNGYVLWIQEYTSLHPELFKERLPLSRYAEIWKGVSDEEKQVKDYTFAGHQ